MAGRSSLGVRGHVRTITRTRKGHLVRRRLDENTPTNVALNAIADWIVGGGSVLVPLPPSYITLGVGPINLLSADQSNLETSAAGWQALSNCSVAQSSAKAWEGVFSLALTAASAATMSASTTPGTGGIPVTAGYVYAASVHFLTAVSARSVSVNIAWYDSSGTLLSTSTGATVTDGTSLWVRAGIVATAPVNAAFAAVVAQVASAASSEVHYADGNQLAYAPDSAPYAWVKGIDPLSPLVPIVSDTQLFQERAGCRKPVDNGYTQMSLAALLHNYQTTDPSGVFTEAGLYDAAATTVALSGSAAAGGSSLSVTGTVPAVVAGQQIYIADDPIAAPGAATFGSASASGGFLIGGTTYYYVITALTALGETTVGAEASYAPSAGSTNQITLTWTPVAGAVGYKVYRGTSPGTEQLLATLNPQTTGSYVDNSNTAPSGAPPSVNRTGGGGEYATIAATAIAGATSWTLTDLLLGTHPTGATVTIFNGNLWAHVALTGTSKTAQQLLTVQWEIETEVGT